MPEKLKWAVYYNARRLSECPSAREAFKFVPRRNLHLTLRFYGEVDTEMLARVKDGLRAACAAHGVLDLKLAGVGGFPNRERPTIAWVGVRGLGGDLLGLQTKIEAAAQQAGLAAEARPFASHVTFGRKRSNRRPEVMPRFLEEACNHEFGEFTVERVTLFSSELGTGPPIYRVLKEFPLT